MRVTGVIIRIIRQFFRDKRSLAMMFGAPMLLLWLLSLVFTQKDYIPQIAVVDMPAQIVKVMKNQEASIYEYSKEKAISELEKQKVDAVFRIENGKMKLLLEGSDSSKNRAVLQVLQKSTEKNDVSIMKPEVNYLHGSKDFTMFDGLYLCINWFLYIFLCIYIIWCIFRKRTFKWYARKVIIHPSKKMGNSRRLYYWFWNLCLYTIHYYRKFFRLYFRFIRSWLHMANVTYYMYALFNCTNIRYVFIGIRK